MALVYIKILAAIGFILSAYAVSVERRRSLFKNYTPFCDISRHVSCTKAFFSPSGKLVFGIPNSVIGLFFYFGVYLLALLGLPRYILYASLFSSVGTLYLAYVSYIKMKNFCIVCTAVYMVNLLLLVFSYRLVY